MVGICGGLASCCPSADRVPRPILVITLQDFKISLVEHGSHGDPHLNTMPVKFVHNILLLALIETWLVLYHISIDEHVAIFAPTILHVVALLIKSSAWLLCEGSELFMVLVDSRAQKP
jgi:hypothetical protein